MELKMNFSVGLKKMEEKIRQAGVEVVPSSDLS